MEIFSEEQIASLISRGVSWVTEQRRIHRPDARPFHDAERKFLEPFWNRDFLDRVRVKEVEKIEIPPDLAAVLLPGFIGITFGDTILLRRSTSNVHFHENIHVAQFDILGVQRFVDAFARGLMSGLTYNENPLERQALELGRRFMENPNVPFDAYETVKSGLLK
ncbi:MAG: hypothetical protein A3G66_01255 [Candidatus Levybacteria bacterium RIFCSPLOWO2_12_FULL_39_17]|nr:MAG: hypothetical protein A3H82_01610 [Candidatus Levybacteria bacterium RIFCSPLOWO2_02_FULL_39_26]OGH47406.1 MAG: hypothetical protein A3G66_01255 [Candidatus Levybacteria bacterium RIFCSPLOWO2_12_FULL_39_17]HCE31488.1 hypothetical protein [Candidatus Daviesbacteria bacterium]